MNESEKERKRKISKKEKIMRSTKYLVQTLIFGDATPALVANYFIFNLRHIVFNFKNNA